jgi:acetyltransferase-like isoleucine patch superfamily enzyme
MSIVNVNKHDSVKIIEPVNLYGCTLSEYVFIGPFVEIQSNVFIGENTRIQSHTFICSNVKIGKDCFIAHGVMFTNDKFSDMKINQDQFLNTVIGNNVLIGSNATVLPVEICDDVVIGAGSVVTKNITDKGVYAGNPAKKIN